MLCNCINFPIASLNRVHQKSMSFSFWLHEKTASSWKKCEEQTRSCKNAQTSRWSADFLDVWRCVREATANEIKSGIINIIVGTRLGANSMFYILFYLFFRSLQLRSGCCIFIWLSLFVSLACSHTVVTKCNGQQHMLWMPIVFPFVNFWLWEILFLESSKDRSYFISVFAIARARVFASNVSIM